MPKFPWMQFYTGDWLKDPLLSMCSASTRGIWIDAVCAMRELDGKGVLEGTVQQLGQMLRASPPEITSAVDELAQTGAATVHISNGKIRLINRRMSREHKNRKSGAERQARMRANGGGDPERWSAIRVEILTRDDYKCQYCGKKAVTVDHIFPKSLGGNENSDNLVACCKSCNMFKGNRTLEQCGLRLKKKRDTSLTGRVTVKKHFSDSDSSSLFESFYKEYPRKENKQKAKEEFMKSGIIEEDMPGIIQWLQKAKLSEQWSNPEFIPHPSTWLHQRRWESDPPPAKKRDTVGAPDPSEFTIPWTEEECKEFERTHGPEDIETMKQYKEKLQQRAKARNLD